jgi:sugar lactone lactonase YvrE
MFRSAAVASLLALPLLLTGCALTNTASPVEEHGLPIQGRIMGGQQPVAGANVYLLAANNTGYPTATTGASKSIMRFVSGSTGIDTSSGPTNGFYYVTTDNGGRFSITGDYSCTSGQQVYLYVVGGNPGAVPNSAAGFLAVLGDCPSAGNFLSSVPFISVNEVTTIAAAYSMSAFAYDALHVSSPNTTLAKTNLKNAFANAGNIVDISTGLPFTTLPNGGSGSLNSLDTPANVLAACVNSTGPSSSYCATLFALAKTNGSTGTAPTDTATAAINIAHNQGLNVAALYSIIGPNPPFVPYYGTAPADFALPVQFVNSTIGNANAVAIDGGGNVWVATSTDGNTGSLDGVAELSPQAALLLNSGPSGLTSAATDLAVLTNGNIMVSAGSKVFYYTPGGGWNNYSYTYAPITVLEDKNGGFDFIDNGSGGQPYLNAIYAPGTNDHSSHGLVTDSNGNFWSANAASDTLTKWNSSYALVSPSTGGYSIAGGTPENLAVDASNNIWVSIASNSPSGQLAEYSNAGTLLNAFGDPNMNGGASVLVDGGGNIWLTGYGTATFAEFDSQGNFLQDFGRVANASTNSHRFAFDGSGNLWTANGVSVIQYIGIATPLVTPIAANLMSPYTAPVNKP